MKSVAKHSQRHLRVCQCQTGSLLPKKQKSNRNKKAFITLCSPVVPLLSTSKADSGLASEFRWDRAIYTAYERMLKVNGESSALQCKQQLSEEKASSTQSVVGCSGGKRSATAVRQRGGTRGLPALRSLSRSLSCIAQSCVLSKKEIDAYCSLVDKQ